MKFVLAIIGFFIVIPYSYSKDVIKDEVIVNCSITPSVDEDNFYPGTSNIKKTNNLRRKTGNPLFARGRFIRLVGKVVDSSCVPVGDAQIEIWHANEAGFYNSEIKKNNDAYDPFFNESGRTKTDNMGNYEFLTIYPGRHGKEAPRINVKVMHPEFDELNVSIYFEDEKMNYYDKFLSRFFGKELNRYMAKKSARYANMDPQETIYYYVITLNGKNKFKRY